MTTRTQTPNLFGIRLAHRVMLRDMHRLTDVAERIARGELYHPTGRRTSIAAVSIRALPRSTWG